MLTSDDGADFEVFLSAVEELGYACAWRVLDAKHFGLPQRRRRLWIVGERSRSTGGPEAILALNESQAGYPPTRRPAWKSSARRAQAIAGDLTPEQDVDWSLAQSWLSERVGGEMSSKAAGEHGRPGVSFAADMRHVTLSKEVQTLQVGPASGWSLNATPCVIQQDGDGWLARRFSPLECLRLQGFDDDWLDGVKCQGQPLTDTDKYRLIGNAWSVPVAAWILERLLSAHHARGVMPPTTTEKFTKHPGRKSYITPT